MIEFAETNCRSSSNWLVIIVVHDDIIGEIALFINNAIIIKIILNQSVVNGSKNKARKITDFINTVSETILEAPILSIAYPQKGPYIIDGTCNKTPATAIKNAWFVFS